MAYNFFINYPQEHLIFYEPPRCIVVVVFIL